MNTRKLLVAIIFLSSTQLAFASSSIDNLTQKNQQKNIETTQKYAASNNKSVPEIVDYKYGMPIDVKKLIHATKEIKTCGNYKKIMSFEDSQGDLHAVRYTVLGSCRQSEG